MIRHSNTQGRRNSEWSHQPCRSFRQSITRFMGGIFVAACLATFSASTHAANIVVNSNDDTDDGVCDSNHCSLREAINYANALPGPDVITFNTGPTTIYPNSVLPALTDDGTTIRGYKEITINGSNLAYDPGLVIQSSYNKIQGLLIRDFNGYGGYGILLDPDMDHLHVDHNVIGVDGDGVTDAYEGNVIFSNDMDGIRFDDNHPAYTSADHNVIAGNIIGLNPLGTEARPNLHGISMFASASYNRIGTNYDGISDHLERNIVSGNNAHGVALPENGVSNTVQGNYIGTDITGTKGVGNGASGVSIYFTDHNIVRGNVIADNGSNGVSLGGAAHNVVLGNKIGTDVTGTQDLGNGFNGIRIFGFPMFPANHNQVGFAGSYVEEFVVEPNIIAYNNNHGIWVDSNTEEYQAFNNAFLYNSIFENGGLGIDLVSSDCINCCSDGVTFNDPNDSDGGGNHALNYPDIKYAQAGGNNTYVSAEINAGLANSWFIVQFFASPAPDASGYGEGATYLGQAYVTTDALGNGSTGFVSLNTATPVGYSISCTATLHNQWGPIETSEFSAAVSVKQSLVFPHLDLIEQLLDLLAGFEENQELEPFVADPMMSLLVAMQSPVMDEDFATAMVYMEEFDWYLNELVPASRLLPRGAGDELQDLAGQLKEKLASSDDGGSRERQ